MSAVESRLAEKGLTLPEVAVPVAAYIPAVKSGNLVFTSGQLPSVAGQLIAAGHVGAEVDPETANKCAQQCALNALAAIKSVIGDLDKVVRVVKVVGFVAAAPGFVAVPPVVNAVVVPIQILPLCSITILISEPVWETKERSFVPF